MLNRLTNFALQATIVLSATAVVAQENAAERTRGRNDLDAIRKVSSLIGTDVMNSANSKVAVIRDLALSADGSVPYAILGTGGIVGVGETYTAAPLDALRFRTDNSKWTVDLNMTADDLKKAPVMKGDNYQELADSAWLGQVDQFFRRRGEAQEGNAQTRDRSTRQDRQAADRLLLATKVKGAKLRNQGNVELGKMEDMLLDRNYRVAFAIVGEGGVLGIGENYIPVPWSKLSFNLYKDGTTTTAMIDASKDQLEKAPLIKGSNYATMLAPGFAEEVRQYFKVRRDEKSTTDDGKGR